LKSDGTPYCFEDLYDDQKEIVLVIANKVMEWATCEDLRTFEPLRMIINGPAGTGKTVVINTIVAILRSIFQDNGVAKVVAPTGTAAFNAGGETIHHFFGRKANQDEYIPHNLSDEKKKKIFKRVKNLICLIIDEQSLLDNKLLGTAEMIMSEMFLNGEHEDRSWGALPILVMVGDDYQLPGIGKGAFDVLHSNNASKVEANGQRKMIECSHTVMSLTSSKRIQKDKHADKILLSKLRTADQLSEDEVQRLLNLSLDSIEERHSMTVVNDIKARSVFLYYRNAPRIVKNLELLIANSSSHNPVAICKVQSQGRKAAGMGIKAHFRKRENEDNAKSCMLCVNAKVALDGRNFCPQWGLHNGAVGTVKEIVFGEGKDPNNGDLPEYVVVDFPQYCGPTWDENNKKVSLKLQ